MPTVDLTSADLSGKWRITGSRQKALDLLNIQRSLSVVAGHFSGNKLKSFRFGQHTCATENGDIFFDVKSIMDEPSPLPAARLDVIVGMIVHESMHVLTRSTDAHNRNLNHSGTGFPITYHDLEALGEEVYVDNFARRHLGAVAPEYLRRARGFFSPDLKDPKGIYNILLTEQVYGHDPAGNKDGRDELDANETERMIFFLVESLCKNLAQQDQSFSQRQTSYANAWSAIEKLVNTNVEQQKVASEMASEGLGFPSEGQGRGKSKAEAALENLRRANQVLGLTPQSKIQDPIDPNKGLSMPTESTKAAQRTEQNLAAKANGPSMQKVTNTDGQTNMEKIEGVKELQLGQALLQAIQEAEDNGTEDMTIIVSGYQTEEFGDASTMAVTYETASKEAQEYAEWDESLYKELIWLRDLKNTFGKETSRGEERGQIDRHSLHRASIDGKVFKQIHRKQRKDKKVVCLLDASGSMGNSMEIYEAAHALIKVVKGTEVLSYDSRGHACVIVRQTSKTGMKRISPGGGTPSGQALLATAVKFPDSIIVHFTDGDGNHGFTTDQAFTILEKEFPRVQVLDVQMRPDEWQHESGDIRPNVTRVSIAETGEFPAILKEAIKPWVMGGV